MKEIAEYLCDEFVDFEGKKHKFVLCALSKDSELDLCSEEFVAPTVKTVSIGCSVCNLNDTYDEELGRKIAYNRAKSDKFVPALVSTVKGLITTNLVQTLLRQEADYIKRDPNCIIPGYNEKAKKVEVKNEAKKIYSELTSEEQALVQLASKYNLDYYAKLAETLNK